MECEIYNEIAEENSYKAMIEDDTIDWFEVYADDQN